LNGPNIVTSKQNETTFIGTDKGVQAWPSGSGFAFSMPKGVLSVSVGSGSPVPYTGPASCLSTSVVSQSNPPVSTPISGTIPDPLGSYGIAHDSRGDIFAVDTATNAVTVIPAATGTIFGQSVTAGTPTTLSAATGLNGPSSLAFDAQGDLYIANAGTPFSSNQTNVNTIMVIPATTTTLCGQPVTANTIAVLNAATGLSDPSSLAFDAQGDLYVANFVGGGVTVLPTATKVIFGQPVTANTSANLAVTGGVPMMSVAFDSQGNLYMGSSTSSSTGQGIYVVPVASGTLFTQSVSADTLNQISATSGANGIGPSFPYSLAFDSQGDLFVGGGGSVSILPATTGTEFGSSVTAGVVTKITPRGSTAQMAITFDSAGDLDVAGLGTSLVSKIAP
jgi:hypothetical protein